MCRPIYHICIIQNPSSKCSRQRASVFLFSLFFLPPLQQTAKSAGCNLCIFYSFPGDDSRQSLVNCYISEPRLLYHSSSRPANLFSMCIWVIIHFKAHLPMMLLNIFLRKLVIGMNVMETL